MEVDLKRFSEAWDGALLRQLLYYMEIHREIFSSIFCSNSSFVCMFSAEGLKSALNWNLYLLIGEFQKIFSLT